MTPPATNSPEQLISVEAAAGRLDVSLRSLYRLIAQKELPPPLKVGRSSKLRGKQTKLAVKTLNEYLNFAHTFLNWLKRNKRIAANPLESVPKVDLPRRARSSA